MREYRLYVLEAGCLTWPAELHALDDMEAIEIAEKKWIDGWKMELWEHHRHVRSWGIPNPPFQQT